MSGRPPVYTFEDRFPWELCDDYDYYKLPLNENCTSATHGFLSA